LGIGLALIGLGLGSVLTGLGRGTSLAGYERMTVLEGPIFYEDSIFYWGSRCYYLS